MKPVDQPVPSATDIEATLRGALSADRLEVIDESAAHAGHAGANNHDSGIAFSLSHSGLRFLCFIGNM